MTLFSPLTLPSPSTNRPMVRATTKFKPAVSRARKCSRTATIQDLPTEILSIIFTLCGTKDVFYPDYHIRTVLSLVVVCRRWHEIIMDSPKLWAGLLDYGAAPRIVNQVLSLSKNAPLEITLPSLMRPFKHIFYEMRQDLFFDRPKPPFPLSDWLLDPAIPYTPRWLSDPTSFDVSVLHRCEQLELHFFSENFFTQMKSKRIVANLSKIRTVILAQTFSLQAIPLMNETEANLSDSGSSWDLRNLYLRRCNLPLRISAFNALEVLDVTMVCRSVAGWLDVLRTMPRLNRFSLKSSILQQLPDVRRDELSFIPNVSLPQLKELYIDSDFGDGYDLVRRLEFPSDCRTWMRSVDLPDETELKAFGRHLEKHKIGMHTDAIRLSIAHTGCRVSVGTLDDQGTWQGALQMEVRASARNVSHFFYPATPFTRIIRMLKLYCEKVKTIVISTFALGEFPIAEVFSLFKAATNVITYKEFTRWILDTLLCDPLDIDLPDKMKNTRNVLGPSIFPFDLGNEDFAENVEVDAGAQDRFNRLFRLDYQLYHIFYRQNKPDLYARLLHRRSKMTLTTITEKSSD